MEHKIARREFGKLLIAATALPGCGGIEEILSPEPNLSFTHISDQRAYSSTRYDNPSIRDNGVVALFLRGTVEAIEEIGKGDFLISSGDNSVDANMWTIRKYLGEKHPAYFAVGNHEVKDGDMWPLINHNRKRGNLPNVVGWGPGGASTPLSFNPEDTSYSFEWEDCHFSMMNPYFRRDKEHVSLPAPIRGWIERDLRNTTKKYKFVICHEPGYPALDMDTHKIRHIGSSLDYTPSLRNWFWNLLAENNVTAYLCGHTHSCSTEKIDGVWQIDAGNSVGPNVLQNYATFSKFKVYDDKVIVDTYRRNVSSTSFRLRQSMDLVHYHPIAGHM